MTLGEAVKAQGSPSVIMTETGFSQALGWPMPCHANNPNFFRIP